MTTNPASSLAPVSPNGPISHPSPADSLANFFEEVNRLALRLRRLRLSAGGSSILQILDRGPQTVPQLARARSTSRQNIQVLVNGLRSERLVELASNPAHRRSALVCLTGEGRALLGRETGREDELLERLAPHFSTAAILAASDLLKEMQGLLSAESGHGQRRRPEPRAAPVTGLGQAEGGELPVNLL